MLQFSKWACRPLFGLTMMTLVVEGFDVKSVTTKMGRLKANFRSRMRVIVGTGSYGRGAEIWPECNEDPVQLADSFPNGVVPPTVILAMERADMESVHNLVKESVNDDSTATATEEEQEETTSKRKKLSRGIKRILQRAAAKEELEFEDSPTQMDRTPSVVAIALLLRGLVRPLDVAVVSMLTAYFTILEFAARSPRDEDRGGPPILPSLPPQGHVPTMVSDPMGYSFTYSKQYNNWLGLGVVTGLLGPILLLSWHVVRKEMSAARMCSRPVFLLCCQAISEAFSRRIMAPLPLRILVPVAYNTVRLGYLWNWVLNSGGSNLMGKVLAVANLTYWAANLFAFLLPIATLRYMRAHFFGVEAESVTTRAGMEESVGLIPRR